MDFLNFFKKDVKYIAIFCRKKNNTYYKLGKKKITDLTAKTIKLSKDNTYNLNLNFPTFNKKNTFYYFIDIDTNMPLLFNDLEKIIDAKDFALVMNNKLMKVLTTGLDPRRGGFHIVSIVIGLVIGFMVGAFIFYSI